VKALTGGGVMLAACAGAGTHGSDLAGAGGGNASLARIVRQCALVASCADEHDATMLRTPQGCVDWYTVNARDEAPLADCVMRAKSCADLNTCTHARADAVAETYCKAHPSAITACDGNTLLACEGEGSAESTAIDCATFGGTCTEHKADGLVVRGCLSPKLCPEGAPEHRCAAQGDGPDAVIDCDDGIVDENECPPGSRCVTGTDAYGAPTARCQSASGHECTIAGGAFCEGDVAYVCVQSGRFAGLHSADCGALGLGCVTRSGHVSCVRRGAPVCSGPATCAGGDLEVCAGGEPFRVSCRALGFDGCDPAGGGGEALCMARVR
jgi:hypothetical protein